MRVHIHSLKETFFDGTARSITAPSTSGEITILADHRPLITRLASGMMKITPESGDDVYVPLTSGFLEVRDNEVTVLVD